jgi:hypothetical protein
MYSRKYVSFACMFTFACTHVGMFVSGSYSHIYMNIHYSRRYIHIHYVFEHMHTTTGGCCYVLSMFMGSVSTMPLWMR